jgi:hypothetical protein
MTNTEFLSNIPNELRTPPLWCQYYLKSDPEHPDKKPKKQPVVAWSNRANLRPLDYLLQNRKSTKHDGFQRLVDPAESLVYVDIDHCRDKNSGTIEPWAEEIVNALDTYTEASPSGTGLRIIARGKLPADHKDPPIEIYGGHIAKLMAMTGQTLDVFHAAIESRQEQIDKLFQKVKGTAATPPKVEQALAAPGKRKELEAELDDLSTRFVIEHTAGRPTEKLSTKIAAVAQALKEVEAPPKPTTWRDLFHTGSELDSTPSKVFIKGILEEGITFFGALSGVGKTWIGLGIAHALLSGDPLFGVFPVLQKTNVLYLVPEMGGRKFRERLAKMRISMDGDFFCQTIKDGACDLDDPMLLQAVKDTQGVVILDTAIRFQAGDEQSSSQQAQGLGAKMFRLIAAGAPAIICMHHRAKDRKDKEPTLENTLRGTGDFGAMADCVWCVEHSRKKKSEDSWGFDSAYEEESKHLTRLTLTCVKPRDMEPADPFTIQGRPYINEKGDFVVLESDGGDDAASTKELSADADKVRKMVEKVRVNPKTSSRELRKDTGFGLSRVKKEMQEKGYIQEDGVWVNKEATIFDSVEGEPLM